MATLMDRFTVIFPEDYDAQSEYETPFRGYLSNVDVQLPDGARYQVFFIDPVRLQQDLAEHVRTGEPFFAEPNMIVVPEVTTESIQKTVAGLVEQNYFRHLKPL
jgi:hypothetical protein